MHFDRSILLALILSTVPIVVLAHGWFGAGTVFTALLMTGSTGALVVLGRWRWRNWDLTKADALFVLFAFCMVASFILNGIGDNKEMVLLVISMAAYPAARGMVDRDVLTRPFLVTLGLVATAGTLVTGATLIEQWNDISHGKPMVFGEYDAAPAQFAMVGCIFLLAVISTKLTMRRAVVISGLMLIPVVIFAASIVRFTFIALALTLLVSLVLGPKEKRRYIAMFLCATVGGVLLGNGIRPVSAQFAQHAVNTLTGAPPAIVNGCPQVDPKNSIAIRKQLYADAFALLPESGYFGLGLDSFAGRPCMKGFEVPNSVLQAAVEFGLPAGILLVLLIVATTGRMVQVLARFSAEAFFALHGLIFVLLISMAHGRISRDSVLFLFVGYAAAILARSYETVKQWRMASDPGPNE